MSTEEIRVPDLGGSDEVEIIEISVQVGDAVAEEDPILVVESDKATVELPAPFAGKLRELNVSVGDKVSEGDLVGLMETEGAGSDPAEAPADAAPAQPEDANAGVRSPGQSAPDPEKPAPDPGKAAPDPEKPAPQASGSRQETVKVPDIGGSEKVPIIELQVKEGDTIAVDDPLLTLESDKASMEVPAPFAGTVGKLLVQVDDRVSEGDALLEMTVTDTGPDQDASAGAPGPSAEPVPPATAQPGEKPGEPASDSARPASPPKPEPARDTAEAPVEGGTRVHAGPAVRKLARELGVDLPRVKGSGPRSRILKDDVQHYVKQQLKQSQGGVPSGTGGALPGVRLPDFSKFGPTERQPMSRLHSLTADSMQRSWLNVPHVTQFEEADITDLEAFRKAQKGAGEKQGLKITPLPFLLKACAYALKAQPAFNVSLDMDQREIVQKQYVHIGLAVDTPAGLVVPVIRDVDRKGIWELAREAQELAAKARDKKLSPAEMQGACFTITSLGGIGGTAFTPIVNTPEVAILGVSKAAMKPLWDGEGFQPRLMLPLSLSYDHRAVNGAEAARFTTLLKRLLEDLRELMM